MGGGGEFPRHHRRGLIEARRMGRLCGSGPRHFRVITDAASLKLEFEAPGLADFSRFPRHHRRGLIEAVVRLLISFPRSSFPRHHRRGLIEARIALSVQRDHPRISASSQTRPH